MARPKPLSTLTALYALYLSSLPTTTAWTFTWRNASTSTDTITNESGTAGQPCKNINHPEGEPYSFDPESSIVRLHLYRQPNCTGTSTKAEHSLTETADNPIRAFAVINLEGADSSSGELVEFPGSDWFKSAPYSSIVTAMGHRLVEEGCDEYSVGPGPQWSDADRESYRCWQGKLGYSGKDADGWPGKLSWDQLKVPVSGGDDDEDDDSGSETSTTTTTTEASTSSSTETSTPTSTSTPVPEASSESDGDSLGGGAIAGIVVGAVVGLGIIAALIYLARRLKRSSTPKDGEEEQLPEPEPERGPEGGGSIGGGGSDDMSGATTLTPAAAAALTSQAVSEPEKTSLDGLPAEVEAIPAKNQKRFVELPGDIGSAELSDSRRINELSDSRRVYEMGDGRKLKAME
ncbi:hypothetical protein BJY04DRAFT_3931 [Aspergillus karnatakaensis]|uniref:uncharacterized protein n=1 Tax=Aspergillus karnatakaensis TaxID=1810916 RepID=UPI003CCDAB73